MEDANADVAAVSLLTMIVTEARYIPPCLANYPVRFGTFTSPTNTDVRQLYNLEFHALAFHAACFSWVIYLFNSGHFASTISMRNLPFDVMLACDPYAYGRAQFAEFTRCQCILPSAAALLDHVPGSGEQGLVDGYQSTHIAIRAVSRQMRSGAFKLSSLVKCTLFKNYACLWHLSTRIMMVGAFSSSLLSSQNLDG